MGENTSAAIVFILIFFLAMLVPCLGAAVIGCKLIDKLGRFPSKTPVIQTGILIPFVVLEVVSLTMLVVFFKVLTAE